MLAALSVRTAWLVPCFTLLITDAVSGFYNLTVMVLEQTQADLHILKALPGWQKLQCVQSQRFFVVNGNAYFSRPSPRLLDSLEIMYNILSGTEDSRYQLIT